MNKLIKYLVTIVCLAILVVLVGPTTRVIVKANEKMDWTKTNKANEASDLNDITYIKNKAYVAVGDDGTIVRSTDAKKWVDVRLQTGENLNSVASNGKNYVVAGNNGTLLYSENGSKWSKGKVKLSKDYTYIKLYNKTVKHIDSEYNVKWNTLAKQSQLQVQDVLWDGKQYVAIALWQVETGSFKQKIYYQSPTVSLSCNFVLTSKDGKTWNSRRIETPNLEKIIYNGKKYIAVSEKAICFSEDLKKFKVTKPKIAGVITDIIYTNNKYTLVTWDGTYTAPQGNLYNSANGMEWKRVINKANLGTDRKENYNGFADLMMECITWSGEEYVISGYKGMILTSTNSTSWKKLNENKSITFGGFDSAFLGGTDAYINKVIYDGEQFIQVGQRGTILVTKDLVEGDIARTRTVTDFRSLVHDGAKRYLGLGRDGEIWESRDGYNWGTVNLEDSSIEWDDVAANKGVAIAVGSRKYGWLSYSDCFYYYSDKPGSWVEMSFPKEFNIVYSVKYTNDRFYVFTDDGALTSKDGKKWSGYTNTKMPLAKIVYNKGVYIGTRSRTEWGINTNALYTSTDFKKWSRVLLKRKGVKGYLSADSIVWNGKQFVTIGGMFHTMGNGYSGNNVVASSKDGMNWSMKDCEEEDYVYGVYGNKTYVAVSLSGDLYSSTDSIHYKKINKNTSQIMNTLLWDGKKFLAAGEYGIIITSAKNKNATASIENKPIDKLIPYSLVQ